MAHTPAMFMNRRYRRAHARRSPSHTQRYGARLPIRERTAHGLRISCHPGSCQPANAPVSAGCQPGDGPYACHVHESPRSRTALTKSHANTAHGLRTSCHPGSCQPANAPVSAGYQPGDGPYACHVHESPQSPRSRTALTKSHAKIRRSRTDTRTHGAWLANILPSRFVPTGKRPGERRVSARRWPIRLPCS